MSLDPTSSTFTTGAAEIGYQALGGLFTEFSPTGTTKILQPELATGYTYSNNFRTLTVTLRKGVEFQDGTPFNATAAIWNSGLVLRNQKLQAAIAAACYMECVFRDMNSAGR